jgi:hypothetical protein
MEVGCTVGVWTLTMVAMTVDECIAALKRRLDCCESGRDLLAFGRKKNSMPELYSAVSR